ncbi:MAG: peptidase C1A papain [Bacteroidetes bacterium]|nr:MAG: peptidase C1A papain [Bacteroidota bacterium]
MPIRMVDDPNDQGYSGNDEGGGGGGNFPRGGGGGGLFNLLPLLLGLVRSKFGLAIIVIGALLYFTVGQRGCNMLAPESNALSTGGILDPAQFSKAQVYEAKVDDNVKNPLPEYVSLAKFAPPSQNQGKQGSCVAWSSAYTAQTIAISASRGTNPQETAFSPSYMYNQIGLQDCQGSYIIRAMELMQKQGGVPFDQFPYNENNCSTNPTSDLNALAQRNRIEGYNRLTNSDDPNGINLRAIKEHLAKDAPVVIGMMVGGSFMEGMMGRKVWEPTPSDARMLGFGGHAMCVVGYDDRLAGGAFQIMNSWGPEWGQNGLGWVRYADFKNYVREAYGINAIPPQGAALSQAFDCEIGLWESKGQGSGNYLPVSGAGNLVTSRIKKGTLFKLEVKNNTPCYVYVFGRETDGSSYTLFPYPSTTNPTQTAYSPYCGITGVRLFPRGKSMQPDGIGDKDYLAVVVSKTELPWYALNEAISKNRSSYSASLATALSQYGVGKISVTTTGKGTMRFAAPAGATGVAYTVVEISK